MGVLPVVTWRSHAVLKRIQVSHKHKNTEWLVARCSFDGNLGCGLGTSVSIELGLKVNCSAKENTLVCHGEKQQANCCIGPYSSRVLANLGQ